MSTTDNTNPTETPQTPPAGDDPLTSSEPGTPEPEVPSPGPSTPEPTAQVQEPSTQEPTAEVDPLAGDTQDQVQVAVEPEAAPEADEMKQLEDRINQLSTDPEGDDTTDIRAKELVAMVDDIGEPLTQAVANVTGQIQTLIDDASTLASQASADANTDDTQGLAAKVVSLSDLESKLESLKSALSQKVTEVAAKSSDVKKSDDDLAELKAKIGSDYDNAIDSLATMVANVCKFCELIKALKQVMATRAEKRVILRQTVRNEVVKSWTDPRKNRISNMKALLEASLKA